MRKKKNYPQSNLKVLGVVYELQQRGLTPSKEGIEVILHGEFDYSSFSDLTLFSSLTSIHGKRLSAILRFLLSSGLLEEKGVEEQEESYFLLTKEGETIAKEFLFHYHKPALRPSKPEKRKFLNLDFLRED